MLLFFGRLHVKKGLDLLAAAMDALAEDRPDLHVLLAGNDDGALGPFLDMMEEIGLDDRVTALGHGSGESARQAWGAADAFVLPSYSEGFSMAILEALACRLPVLATTACHFPELDDRGAGVVVEPTAARRDRRPPTLLERSPAERRATGPPGPGAGRGAVHLGPPGRAARRRLPLARRRRPRPGGGRRGPGDRRPPPLNLPRRIANDRTEDHPMPSADPEATVDPTGRASRSA